MATRTKKPVKKTSSKTTKKAAAHASPAYKTLRVAKAKQPFLTFRVTRQTAYWTVLVAFVIAMQLLILQAQFNVVQTTDQLQAQINSTGPN